MRMSPAQSPSWTDPDYVATLVGVLAVGALVFYAELVSATLTTGTVVFVVLFVTLPMVVARAIAIRFL